MHVYRVFQNCESENQKADSEELNKQLSYENVGSEMHC